MYYKLTYSFKKLVDKYINSFGNGCTLAEKRKYVILNNLVINRYPHHKYNTIYHEDDTRYGDSWPVREMVQNYPMDWCVVVEDNYNADCFWVGDTICFRIPKRNGRGFLKSAIGYHSLNKSGVLLSELIDDKAYIDIQAGQFCDLDGYLSISIKSKYACTVDLCQYIESEIKPIIQKVFPHICGFNDTNY